MALADGSPAGPLGVDHKDGSVHRRRQQRWVRDRLERRRIQDDQVRIRLEALQDGVPPIGAEQLGRVRGQGTAGDDPELVQLGFLGHGGNSGRLITEEGCEAVLIGQVEQAVHAGLAQVCVHKQNPGAGLGKPAVVVLPSLGNELVISSVRRGLSTQANSILLRRARYVSAAGERGFRSVSSRYSSLRFESPFMTGTTPRVGSPVTS